MNIIVVDDEQAALNTILSHLADKTDLRYTMFRDDPAAAISYALSNKVDAAFLDIVMPELDGVALAEKLVECDKNIRLVFITGYDSRESDIREKFGDNLVDFCYKPFNREHMETIIGSINNYITNNREITVKTFGGFDIFLGTNKLIFNCAKAKELLSLMIHKNGADIVGDTAAGLLWPEKNRKSGIKSYQDAKSKLALTLRNYGLSRIACLTRGKSYIIKSEFTACDIWEAEQTGVYPASPEYLPDYEWAADYRNKIELLLTK